MSDKTIPQSGVVPYFESKDGVRYVLITSNSGKWVFPKGLLEPGITPAESAVEEALEEAGAVGEVEAEPFAEFRYEKWGSECVVAMYLMRVTELHDTWLEDDFRRRRVCSFDEALAIVQARLEDVLRSANERLATD